MVIVDLVPGDHTVKFTLAGYNTLNATINVSSTGIVTCVSVTGGACGGSALPRVAISGSTVTGYLVSVTTPTPTPTPVPVTTYTAWVISIGGSLAIQGNLVAVGSIIDGYIGITYLGFTVTLGNVGTTIDYYLGIGG